MIEDGVEIVVVAVAAVVIRLKELELDHHHVNTCHLGSEHHAVC